MATDFMGYCDRFRWMHGARVLGVGTAPTVTQSHGDERLVALPAPPADADGVMIDGVVIALAP